MSASFVSFVPPRAKGDKLAAPTASFRAVIPPTPATVPLSPGPLLAPAPVAQEAAPVPTPKPTCVPSITLKREQDRITWIVVQCSCWEVTEIDCQYGVEG